MLHGLLIAVTAALAASDVAVDVQTTGRVSRGEVHGTLRVPLDALLTTIADCDGTAAWFPTLSDTHTVARSPTVRCAGRTELPWPLHDRRWAIDIEVPPAPPGVVVIAFRYVPGSGDLVSMEGRYTLRALDPHTTWVSYENTVDLGVWVPAFVVDWVSHDVLPRVLAGLEGAARSGPG
jgi:Polyketide cyclase / dehydrase and lipid transport